MKKKPSLASIKTRLAKTAETFVKQAVETRTLPVPSVSPVERIETKTITLNGKRKRIHLCAYGWETQCAWGHAAYCPELGLFHKIRYYIRTREENRFDTVLEKLFRKYQKLEKESKPTPNATVKKASPKAKQTKGAE